MSTDDIKSALAFDQITDITDDLDFPDIDGYGFYFVIWRIPTVERCLSWYITINSIISTPLAYFHYHFSKLYL